MAQIILGPNLSPNLDGSVKKAAFAFLEKLGTDDTLPGLHIEPINDSIDPRVRTGRVNDMWRALLVKIASADSGTHYVYLGTFPHDEAIVRAKTTAIAINPRNGIAELIDADAASARLTPVAASPASSKPKPEDIDTTVYPLLETQGISHADLTRLGIDPELASRALLVTDEDELLAVLEHPKVAWQADAIIDLAAGTGLDAVIEKLAIALKPEPPAEPAEPAHLDDDDLLAALHQPAAQMDFAFIEDNEALRAAIEDADFGHWRVFLHPEQREYAFSDRNGSFRLTGGAGTGKTVVLIHRALHLWRTDPGSRIILTTYNKTLATTLRETLLLLDKNAPVLSENDLGKPGIYIASVDSIANRVLQKAEGQLGDRGDKPGAITQALGVRSAHYRTPITRASWANVIGEARDELPPELASEAFLSSEYSTVILPNLISTRDAYLRVPRPGRGVRLSRAQRVAVWNIVERYRSAASAKGATDFDEKALIAAIYLNDQATSGGGRLADHVLVDEAQDLAPTRFQLLRALVAEGKNDLFIAEDAQQRIYGQKVVLSRYGINIRGRSRRLTLNYRTTAQNLNYAMGILTGAEWSDLDDTEVDSTGYRSARRGPIPELVGTEAISAAYDELVNRIETWLAEDGIAPETIGVLALTNNQAETLVRVLEEHGIKARYISDDRPIDPGRVLVMTMHRAKGLEFRKEILFGVSADAPYWATSTKNIPEADRADADLRSRSLLYVAATRARDELAIIWNGEPSKLLPVVAR